MSDTAIAAPLPPVERPAEPPGHDAPALLFARYVRALALLCECRPYVDEPDYERQLDALLREACAAYGLEMQHVGGRFEIALPGATPRAALQAACAS